MLAAAVLLTACAAGPRQPSATEASVGTIVAELALERGDCRSAAEAYAGAAAASGSAEANLGRALEVALGCQRYDAAARIAKLWRQRAPQSADAARMAGIVALQVGNNAEAAAAFRDAVRLAGEDPGKALAALAQAASSADNDYGTYVALRFAVEPADLDAPALVLLGDLAFGSFVFRDARALAEAAIARDSQSAPAQMLLAQVLAASGDAAGAIAAANAARRLDPKAQAFALAETLGRLDRVEEARIELERLLQDDDVGPQAERRLALLAFREGDFQEAAGRFSQRLRTGDDPAEALFYLGLLAERHGNEQAALEMYQRLVQAGAGLIARRRAATILMKQDKRDEAFALLDAQAREKPEAVVEVALTKSALLLEQGAAADALQILEAAQARFPAHPGLAYQRALALESAGRIGEAIAAFEALYRKRPDDPGLMNALGYTLADHKKSLARASRLIDGALALTPDNPAILDSQGWVRYRRGEGERALAPLERAYRLSHDTEIAVHWGEVLWSLGREGEARTVWARALARDPESRALKDTLSRHIPAAPQ